MAQARDLVRDGGRAVIVGQSAPDAPLEINRHREVNRKHVEIRGCWGSDYSHFHRVLERAARNGGRVPWRDIVREV